MGSKLRTTCLHRTITINSKDYDLYMGYLSSDEIRKIAEVPSFSKSDSNLDIVENIPPKTDPVEAWQRPVDNEDIKGAKVKSKVTRIAKIYSSSSKDNLMPNPVIISSNPLPSVKSNPRTQVTVTPHIGGSGPGAASVANLFDLEITFVEQDTSKEIEAQRPLWLLDGQHRVAGMVRTEQFTAVGGVDRSGLPIPFILLHGDSYGASQLAEIFTHVTSGATAMDPIHREWMNYSFKLDIYRENHFYNAMEMATHLCLEPKFGVDCTCGKDPCVCGAGGKAVNPFYDNLQFNPHKGSSYYAFSLDCVGLTKLAGNQYYKGNSKALKPKELAAQITYCIKAFESLDKNRDGTKDGGSLLFDNPVQTTSLAQSYLKACLMYLRDDRYSGFTFNEWKAHLKDPIRRFQDTNWRLIGLTGYSGKDSNNAKRLACRVFLKYLRASKTPKEKIGDYLGGADAKFKMVAVHWDPTPLPGKKDGKKRQNSKKFPEYTEEISVGSSKVIFTLGSGGYDRRAFRVEVGDGVENLDILAVYYAEKKPTPKMPAAAKAMSYYCEEELTVGPPTSPLDKFQIIVETQSFSSSTKDTTWVTIERT